MNSFNLLLQISICFIAKITKWRLIESLVFMNKIHMNFQIPHFWTSICIHQYGTYEVSFPHVQFQRVFLSIWKGFFLCKKDREVFTISWASEMCFFKLNFHVNFWSQKLHLTLNKLCICELTSYFKWCLFAIIHGLNVEENPLVLVFTIENLCNKNNLDRHKHLYEI